MSLSVFVCFVVIFGFYLLFFFCLFSFVFVFIICPGFCLFVFFFFFCHAAWFAGSWFPRQGWSLNACGGSTESRPLGCQRIPSPREYQLAWALLEVPISTPRLGSTQLPARSSAGCLRSNNQQDRNTAPLIRRQAVCSHTKLTDTPKHTPWCGPALQRDKTQLQPQSTGTSPSQQEAY